jgi:hypothetical protein
MRADQQTDRLTMGRQSTGSWKRHRHKSVSDFASRPVNDSYSISSSFSYN